MKKIIFVLLVIISTSVSGQTVKSSFGDTITIKRTDEKDLELLKTYSPGAYAHIFSLEKQLNAYKSAVEKNEQIYKPNESISDLNLAKEQLSNTLKSRKSKITNFQLNETAYKNEIAFYCGYNQKKATELKAKEDSINATQRQENVKNAIARDTVGETTIYNRNTATNFVGGSHGNLVVFCGYNINDVQNYFSQYLYIDLGYASAEYSGQEKPNEMVSAYIKKITDNNKKLIVKYGTKIIGDTMFVTSCDITGNWDEVATIFIGYWETKMYLNELKGKSGIVKYTLTDKIIFNSNIQTGTASIHIEKNK